jgi:hypothetical protein
MVAYKHSHFRVKGYGHFSDIAASINAYIDEAKFQNQSRMVPSYIP